MAVELKISAGSVINFYYVFMSFLSPVSQWFYESPIELDSCEVVSIYFTMRVQIFFQLSYIQHSI
jgi:hypothetical protein